MAYITLEDAKTHLRVDTNDDDRYIESLIEVAELSIAENIGITYANLLLSGSYSDLPATLKHAEKLLIGHLYENREVVQIGQAINEIPYSFEFLLNTYRYY